MFITFLLTQAQKAHCASNIPEIIHKDVSPIRDHGNRRHSCHWNQ